MIKHQQLIAYFGSLGREPDEKAVLKNIQRSDHTT
jgi:hypothetical protein